MRQKIYTCNTLVKVRRCHHILLVASFSSCLVLLLALAKYSKLCFCFFGKTKNNRKQEPLLVSRSKFVVSTRWWLVGVCWFYYYYYYYSFFVTAGKGIWSLMTVGEIFLAAPVKDFGGDRWWWGWFDLFIFIYFRRLK